MTLPGCPSRPPLSAGEPGPVTVDSRSALLLNHDSSHWPHGAGAGGHGHSHESGDGCSSGPGPRRRGVRVLDQWSPPRRHRDWLGPGPGRRPRPSRSRCRGLYTDPPSPGTQAQHGASGRARAGPGAVAGGRSSGPCSGWPQPRQQPGPPSAAAPGPGRRRRTYRGWRPARGRSVAARNIMMIRLADFKFRVKSLMLTVTFRVTALPTRVRRRPQLERCKI